MPASAGACLSQVNDLLVFAAKEAEERELKLKCDQLSKESARRSEAERKKLIEKSLNLKVVQNR